MQWVRPKLSPSGPNRPSGGPMPHDPEEGGMPTGTNGGCGARQGEGSGGGAEVEGAACRLNLLLSYAGWDDESWADRLPLLLMPMGVQAIRAASGREAADVIKAHPVHIAVVDLGLPLDASRRGDSPEGGVRLLEVLRRLKQPPPTIVVKRFRGRRDDQRQLAGALRMGAFAVVDRPQDGRGLELMLDVFRRVLHRHYQNQWPSSGPGRNQP